MQNSVANTILIISFLINFISLLSEKQLFNSCYIFRHVKSRDIRHTEELHVYSLESPGPATDGAGRTMCTSTAVPATFQASWHKSSSSSDGSALCDGRLPT